MPSFKLKHKFIGYVDILGFTEHMRAAEKGKGFKPEELFEIAKRLGTIHTRDEFLRHGPTTCPQSKPINRDLDYEVTQQFDCVVISCEPSAVGCLNLVSHCWSASMMLFTKGLLCRGYIMRGDIYHEGYDVSGSGYFDAIKNEKVVSVFKREADERGTPFIEVDPDVANYIEADGDDCARRVFKRLVMTDGELSAIYPFSALSHSFIIAGLGIRFDPDKEKESNNNLRTGLRNVRAKIVELTPAGDASAVRKARHYLDAIDMQLQRCDKLDADLDGMLRPFGISATKERTPGLFLN
jgi:hypothetical protein